MIYPIEYYAGLIEGDGSIYFSKHDNAPVVNYAGTDEDIVARVASMWNRTYGPQSRKKTRLLGYKDAWVTKIGGKHALPIIQSMYPYLWADRRLQIKNCFGYCPDVPLPTPSIPWLAGLLEAEGSFYLCRRSAALKLNMTDLDIIQAFQRVYASTYKIGRRWEKRSTKWAYRVQMSSRKALNLMEEILPYMGTRRNARISWVLENAVVRKE